MSLAGRRVLLVVLALSAAQVGGWAVLAPRSFFEDFPGLGRRWVGVDGPYNEHLVRDVGALYLALLILTVSALRPARPVQAGPRRRRPTSSRPTSSRV